jgi:hypothetical protein
VATDVDGELAFVTGAASKRPVKTVVTLSDEEWAPHAREQTPYIRVAVPRRIK